MKIAINGNQIEGTLQDLAMLVNTLTPRLTLKVQPVMNQTVSTSGAALIEKGEPPRKVLTNGKCPRVYRKNHWVIKHVRHGMKCQYERMDYKTHKWIYYAPCNKTGKHHR